MISTPSPTDSLAPCGRSLILRTTLMTVLAFARTDDSARHRTPVHRITEDNTASVLIQHSVVLEAQILACSPVEDISRGLLG